MGYETGRNRFTFESDGKFDFGGNADGTQIISAFANKAMKIEAIHAQVTEAFVMPTTDAKVQFGTAADADKFGEVTIPTGTKVGSHWWYTDEGGELDIGSEVDNESGGVQQISAADAEAVTVTYKPGTGAGLAGQAHIKIYAKFI